MSQNNPTIDRHDRFMTLNYPRWPIVMAEGAGCELVDDAGDRYLDLFSGFGAGILGHCHEELVAAATKQLTKLWHVGNLLHTEPQTRLAERIATAGFGGRSYFCHSGSDANEAAFKLARLYGGGKRHTILATTHSFHGRGFGAMVATGQPKVRAGFDPLPGGFAHAPYNDLDAIAGAVDDTTVAIIAEPIQGEGGMRVPDPGYWPGLRALCDDRDLLLIADEVWTGCGRTGRWFGYQHWDIKPDIITLGKAVGCGMALGVMCANDKAAAFFDTANYGGVPHATTLGGHCVAMAVSERMFDIIERDGLLQRAEALGNETMDKLRQWADGHPAVVDIRGRGLFIGIEIDLTAAGVAGAGELVIRCLNEQKVLIGSAQNDVLRLAPPLTVEAEQIDRGIEALGAVLGGGS